jgi:excisionase family DNA binding protein
MLKNTEVKALGISAISRAYGFGRTTVKRAIARGELPVTRMGPNKVVIRISDFEEWIGKAKREARAKKG